ncbi:sulfur carrier protein ThiS [Pseudomonas sp. C27(2019)]|uniref:sulfur carrier protein ThiS n=1 Tax=Pseudomonas sp. C27(2019) TaxID=2604941 RepID=UPI001244FF37|nr:sulfur carrier protein ThiS [Pseudomonas sp. C27(2019)]QEY60293.1 sulfur carrier protein ThiS [Pseudomonas sp. C27(2019)]
MDILLNGEPRQLLTATTVLQLLQARGLDVQRVAVELNEEVLPRSEHATYVLRANDRVEIVHAIGGG